MLYYCVIVKDYEEGGKTKAYSFTREDLARAKMREIYEEIKEYDDGIDTYGENKNSFCLGQYEVKMVLRKRPHEDKRNDSNE